MYSRRAALALPALAVLIAACGADEAEPAAPPDGLQPGDELTFELFANTKQLSPEALSGLGEVAADGRLVFDDEPAELAAITRGNVVMAGASAKTPAGLLRFVHKVERVGGKLVLSTVNAPPELAFKNLHLKMNRTVEAETASVPVDNTPLSFVPGVVPGSVHPLGVGGAHAVTPLDYFVFNADKNASTTHDQVHVTGSLGAGFDYFFGLDVDWGGVFDLPGAVVDCVVDVITGGGCSLKDLLPEVSVGYRVQADAKADLAIEGVAFQGFQRDYTLARLPMNPKTITVGPLVFVLSAQVKGHVEGGASSEFAVSTGASFLAKSEISYSSKKGGTFQPWVFERSFTAPSVAAGLTAKAKVSVGPELAIKLFDFAGPYAGVLGFARLEADALKTPCFSAKVGLDGVLGFEIGVDLPVLGKVTLADFSTKDTLLEEEVATGACVLPPNSSSLPPGAGPDIAHLQNPTYTPWSKTFTGFVGQFPHGSSSHAWTDLTRSIDGNYVMAGAGAHALVKLTEKGDVVWARQFRDPEPLFNGDFPLRPGRVAPSDDAEMFVTAYPWTLLKVGQSGGLRWAKRLVTGPHDTADGAAHGNGEENNQIGGALSDGEGGAFLLSSDQPAGSVPPRTRAWFSRISREGVVRTSKALTVAGRQVYPTVVAPADGGVFVSGTLYDKAGEDQGFAMRLTADGSVTWAKRIVGCAGDLPVQPSAAVRTREGKYMIVGRHSLYQRSFSLVLAGADGAFLTATNPYAGDDTEYAVIRSIVELPTSGFAIAGDFSITPGNYRRIFTGGLDSIGVPAWTQGYRFPEREASFPALLATDAGGVFVAAQLDGKNGSAPGELWALTPFARDGKLPINASSGAELETLPFGNGDCTVSVAPLEVVVSDLPVTVTDRPVTVIDLPMSQATQSP